MNRQEFIDSIKLDKVDDGDEYGYYPFSMYVLTADDKMEINALALGGDILAVYRRVGSYRSKMAKQIFLAVDFPANKEIDHDFVACFILNGDKLELILMPYSTETGQFYDWVTESNLIDDLKGQFMKVSSPSITIKLI